jgi:RecG-like helicase
MALRKFVSKIARPVEELDREKLAAFCGSVGAAPIASLHERDQVRTAGEVGVVRIVPRSGAPALEVMLHDGSHMLTAVFLGRRRVPGMTTGRKVAVEGTVMRDGNRLMMLNPTYELF